MDWAPIVLAAIAALPPTLVALAAYVQAIRTHTAVNSRMTELLEITKRQATDAATLAEKKAEQFRKGEAAVAVAGATLPVAGPPKE